MKRLPIVLYRMQLPVLCLAALLLVACLGTPPPEKPDRPPKIGLVLGRGAARGIAHVGVLRVLEEEKIPIDLIVGTSVGSMIGAMYADKPNSFELEWTAFTIKQEDIFDFSLLNINKGLAKGEKMLEFLHAKIATKNIEDLKVPYVAVAADLKTGKMVQIDRGPVADAVRASSSIPGVFVPVTDAQGRTLVDGGVFGNIAPEVAWQRGMDIVIVVDIGEEVRNDDTDGIMKTIMQSISIMGNEIAREKFADADVLIQPDVGHIGMLDFSRKKEMIAAGIEAARKAVPDIRRVIHTWKQGGIKK